MLKMDYEQLLTDAQEADKTTSVSTSQVKWEEEGQRIVGMLFNAELRDDGEYEKPYTLYTLHTSGGLVTCILNDYNDKIISSFNLMGSVVSITFIEKIPLKGGKTFKKFEITVIDTEFVQEKTGEKVKMIDNQKVELAGKTIQEPF